METLLISIAITVTVVLAGAGPTIMHYFSNRPANGELKKLASVTHRLQCNQTTLDIVTKQHKKNA